MTISERPVSSPISYKTKSEAVYAVVREQIMTNELVGGETINQDQLAKSLGTSVTPIREALRRLESEGFVTNEAHHGVVVSPLDLGALGQLFSVKASLELLAAEQAAEAATPEERELILALARPAKQRGAATEVSEWYDNKRFHQAIYTASHNSYLIFFLDSLWERYDRYFNVFQTIVFYDEVAMHEHRQIAEAIGRGNVEQAKRWMEEHHLHGTATTEGITT